MPLRYKEWSFFKKHITNFPQKQTPANSRGLQRLSRRKRDSNPRRCDPQQFSRLPHSTTLPFLLNGDKYTLLFPIRKHFITSLFEIVRSMFLYI